MNDAVKIGGRTRILRSARTFCRPGKPSLGLSFLLCCSEDRRTGGRRGGRDLQCSLQYHFPIAHPLPHPPTPPSPQAPIPHHPIPSYLHPLRPPTSPLPDFPIPQTTTRPLQSKIAATDRAKSSVSRLSNSATDRASILKTRRAESFIFSKSRAILSA